MSQDPFKRNPVEFQLMDQTFKFKMIPSEHFQEVLMAALELVTKLDFVVDDTGSYSFKLDMNKLGPELYQISRKVLNDRVYLLMADVLEHQNSNPVTVSTLKKNVSTLELAQFLALLMEDDELSQAVEVFKTSLGKLRAKLTGSPSQTESFTQSSSPSSDEIPST